MAHLIFLQARQAEKNGHALNNGTFNVARNIDIQLDRVPVSVGDLVQLRYYCELVFFRVPFVLFLAKFIQNAMLMHGLNNGVMA